jgi:hypothetical protein
MQIQHTNLLRPLHASFYRLLVTRRLNVYPAAKYDKTK